jgi:prepilin-type N-terminal cleavage/methylation domain-containing protein
MQRQRRCQRQRGVSMAELLAALLILGIVITTTIAMFAERQARLRDASETILAWQALSNEAEIWRRIDFASLDTTSPSPRRPLTSAR